MRNTPKVACVLLTALCLLAVSATAQAGNQPIQKLPGLCAGAMAVSGADTNRVVLVTLRRYVNSKLQDDIGLNIKWVRGPKIRPAGMAQPGCWNPLPIRPSVLDYRLMSSMLCVTLRNGNTAYSTNPSDPAPACPLPTVTTFKGHKWTMVVFQVISPPDGG